MSTGVTGLPWADAWLRARREQGLVAGTEFPTMPAIHAHGSWGVGPMSTVEASSWLAESLRKYSEGPLDVLLLGTHSLRCTLLS
eukprot:4945265-Amphidinium_carterae.1